MPDLPALPKIESNQELVDVSADIAWQLNHFSKEEIKYILDLVYTILLHTESK